MIVKAMDWIKKHAAPHIREINGVEWTDKQLHQIRDIKSIDSVNLYTLTSLVDYLKSKVDFPNGFIKHIFINIMSPKHISVYSDINEGNYYSRTQIADVTAMLPAVGIGEWVGQTEFCIMLRANFIDTDTNRDDLISVASNIVSGTIAQYEDTGIIQKATLKTGIQETEDKLLPEKVVLRPYRTFMEVEQPISEFIFRARNDRCDSVELSLHEADGGKWKIDAMTSVKEYLEEQLAELPYITIIA